jgi:hypothetical protein
MFFVSQKFDYEKSIDFNLSLFLAVLFPAVNSQAAVKTYNFAFGQKLA